MTIPYNIGTNFYGVLLTRLLRGVTEAHGAFAVGGKFLLTRLLRGVTPVCNVSNTDKGVLLTRLLRGVT